MKPILFSTPMVQAILDGNKTMTRRIIKPQPINGIRESIFVKSGIEDGHGREIKPKYYPGDIIWVKETYSMLNGFAPGEWEKLFPKTTPPNVNDNIYFYKADFSNSSLKHFKEIGEKWHPSIYMPFKAARIFLRVKGVRVEQLIDIPKDDLYKEGIRLYCDGMEYREPYLELERYIKLWDNLNAKSGYGWDTNPYVRVISFERIPREQI